VDNGILQEAVLEKRVQSLIEIPSISYRLSRGLKIV
jgi:hypothetical protein